MKAQSGRTVRNFSEARRKQENGAQMSNDHLPRGPVHRGEATRRVSSDHQEEGNHSYFQLPTVSKVQRSNIRRNAVCGIVSSWSLKSHLLTRGLRAAQPEFKPQPCGSRTHPLSQTRPHTASGLGPGTLNKCLLNGSVTSPWNESGGGGVSGAVGLQPDAVTASLMCPSFVT